VLLGEALKNTVCGVTLLPRSVLVNLESSIDDRLPRAEDRSHPRRRWFSLWRDRGSDRLTHCSSVHPESLGQRADGHFLLIVRPPDLSERFHLGPLHASRFGEWSAEQRILCGGS
jgi:hypothetical protein